MESQKYQRKWEELNRAFERLKKFYQNHAQDEQDSFQGPKDYVNNFFRISYELKEALKRVQNLLLVLPNDVEQFASSDEYIALSLDITNQEKHTKLTRHRTGKSIGQITSHVHICDPNDKNRTEIKIEIDNNKEDCLELAEKIVKAWKTFLTDKNLIS
jgi:hypothetical protein